MVGWLYCPGPDLSAPLHVAIRNCRTLQATSARRAVKIGKLQSVGPIKEGIPDGKRGGTGNRRGLRRRRRALEPLAVPGAVRRQHSGGNGKKKKDGGGGGGGGGY